MDTVILLRAIFWIGFILVFAGIALSIELGSRLVSKLKSRLQEKEAMRPEQLPLFEDSEMLITS